MSHEEYVRTIWIKLIQTLEGMLEGRIGLTEGSRIISPYRDEKSSDEHLFIPFLAFDSETDIYPLGDVRKLWAEEPLAKLDIERERYETRSKERIFKAAQKLLDHARVAVEQINAQIKATEE